MASRAGRPRSGALDVVLGQRIRARRLELALTQAELAGRIGLTFQQVQKYENGSNRVTALMLVKLARALDLGVTDLLRELDAEPSAGPIEDQTEQLLTSFAEIRNFEVREAVVTIVRRLAASES